MRVTTFGEIMLRLTVPDNKKLIQTDTFQANYGVPKPTLQYRWLYWAIQ